MAKKQPTLNATQTASLIAMHELSPNFRAKIPISHVIEYSILRPTKGELENLDVDDLVIAEDGFIRFTRSGRSFAITIFKEYKAAVLGLEPEKAMLFAINRNMGKAILVSEMALHALAQSIGIRDEHWPDVLAWLIRYRHIKQHSERLYQLWTLHNELSEKDYRSDQIHRVLYKLEKRSENERAFKERKAEVANKKFPLSIWIKIKASAPDTFTLWCFEAIKWLLVLLVASLMPRCSCLNTGEPSQKELEERINRIENRLWPSSQPTAK